MYLICDKKGNIMKVHAVSKVLVILILILPSCRQAEDKTPQYDPCSTILIDGYTEKISNSLEKP
jgi:hypothetical protein